MKEHLEEEADAKIEVERQLSKAFADIQLWKTRYETEGVARCEEIDKVKMSGVRGLKTCPNPTLPVG